MPRRFAGPLPLPLRPGAGAGTDALESSLLVLGLVLLARSAPIHSAPLGAALGGLLVALLGLSIALRGPREHRALRAGGAVLLSLGVLRLFTAWTPIPEAAVPMLLVVLLPLFGATRSPVRTWVLASFFFACTAPRSSTSR